MPNANVCMIGLHYCNLFHMRSPPDILTHQLPLINVIKRQEVPSSGASLNFNKHLLPMGPKFSCFFLTGANTPIHPLCMGVVYITPII